MHEPDEQVQARRLAWLRRGVWTVLAAGVLAFLVEGADLPADPVLAPAVDAADAASDGAEASQAAAAPPPIPKLSTTDVTADSTREEADSQAAEPIPSPSRAGTAPAVPAPPSPAPSTGPDPAPAPVRRPLPGFGEVLFRITSPGGRTTDGVALLADDPRSRGQGLMEQTDLRGYDAMVFRFEQPSTGSFFMRNTRIPLSIAFFDLGGRYVSATDMVPCPDEVEDCPSYFPEGSYVHAIEVALGDLPRLGIGPGAVLSFPR